MYNVSRKNAESEALLVDNPRWVELMFALHARASLFSVYSLCTIICFCTLFVTIQVIFHTTTIILHTDSRSAQDSEDRWLWDSVNSTSELQAQMASGRLSIWLCDASTCRRYWNRKNSHDGSFVRRLLWRSTSSSSKGGWTVLSSELWVWSNRVGERRPPCASSGSWLSPSVDIFSTNNKKACVNVWLNALKHNWHAQSEKVE